MASTRANKNREIRQDNLREWLSKKCTLQHLFDNIIKIEELDILEDGFSNSLAKYKVANEQRLKLINKYLPELKATEITGKDGGAITFEVWLSELE